ncbi:MAG: prephenate dehydratase [Bacteriovoracaceae bacterium]|nr:prephenate dehydratase [Bacteriovoracaceae bacterium]
MKKVAFQGENGAYSEAAMYRFFGEDVEPYPCELSEDTFESLNSGQVDFIIVPVENSIAGNVNVNLDLIYLHNFFIIGELYFPINHCLMARPGVAFEDIKVVTSHPVALAQCRNFLNKHKIKIVPEYDTAGACQMLSLNDTATEHGAIASALCENYYDLEIVKTNIQNVKINITRFLVLCPPDHIPKELHREKTSMAFSTKHHPGALFNCLKKFAQHGLNLTKIESRPIPNNPFAYNFFIDFSGSNREDNVLDCLEELGADANNIKILGSYPSGKKLTKAHSS